MTNYTQLSAAGRSLWLCTLIVLSGCMAESAPTPTQWQMTQNGDNNHYQAQLSCETAPTPGPFQHCTVHVTDLHHRSINPESILIDGGMPQHGHGLPTAPVLVPLETGRYRIDGLKYNMPGAWLLGFKITASQEKGDLIEDTVIFAFSL